ncbi:MAG: hypothetical protein VST72_00010 [Nitrospirota bacterium]|nr:hypothetical protein [Nitrospirota bacterium]
MKEDQDIIRIEDHEQYSGAKIVERILKKANPPQDYPCSPVIISGGK